MFFLRILRLLSSPFRAIARFFRRGARRGGSARRAAVKTAGSAAARAAAANAILEEEIREEPPSGVETMLFRQLPRPHLTERTASELTLEQARAYAEQSQRFYDYGFPLFARGDFFYEEVEEEFLNAALGGGSESVDQRFIEVTTLFRKTLNDNTRRLLVCWTPGVFVICFAAGAYFAYADVGASALEGPARIATSYGFALVAAVFFAFLIFSWPYKVVQQRNLMSLDNYITSKFARINNNFQVAKRRALNVERDKRMAQREELKEEAGVWTLAYHWFAMRLFLGELMIRNKFYQVRRNTTLYWLAGLALTILALAGFAVILALAGAPVQGLAIFSAAGLAYIVFAAAAMRRAAPMMFAVLESNEWSRFHLINLHQTIRDHVGEDKVQIVTFRDRNRFE